MADYRQIHTHIWADDWFLNLELDAKLFFIYLFSNRRSCLAGIYDIGLRVMEFETGLSQERILELFAEFAGRGKAYYEDGFVWVPNMIIYNTNNLKSIQVQANIRHTLMDIPDIPLRARWLERFHGIISRRYGVDTVSILCGIPSLQSGIPSLHNRSEQSRAVAEQPKQTASAPEPIEEEQEPTTTTTTPPNEQQHPAIAIFEEETRLPIANVTQFEDIVGTIDTNPTSLNLWRAVVHGHMAQGWKPYNITCMLDYYRRGEVPGQLQPGGAKKANAPPGKPKTIDLGGDADWMKF